MSSYDVAIIGLSFAGLTLAHHLPKHLKILMVDVKPEAGFNVESTGLITEHTRHEFAEFFDIDRYITNKITGLGVIAPNFDDYFISRTTEPWIYQTDTKGLIKALAATLPSNVTVKTRTALQTASRIAIGNDQRENAINSERPLAWKKNTTYSTKPSAGKNKPADGITLELVANGKPEKVFTRFLVGADGRRSKVAALFPELDRNKKFLFGYEQVFFGNIHLGTEPEKTVYHFWLGELGSGYGGWFSPTVLNGRKAFRVGLAQHLQNQSNIHGVFQKFFQELLKRKIVTVDGDMQKPLYHFGCPIPIGGALKKFSTDGVLLIGDSAGFCGAFAADGIKGAVISAKKGAKVIGRFLNGEKAALLELHSLMNEHNKLMDYYKRQVRYRWLWNLMKRDRTFQCMFEIIRAESDTFLQQYCDSKDKRTSLLRTIIKVKHFPKLMKLSRCLLGDLLRIKSR